MAGPRAVPHLVTIAGDEQAATSARVAAFAALEASPGAKGVVAVAASASESSDDEVALAAIDCLAYAVHVDGPPSTAAFDRLAAIALSSTAAVPHRLAALSALDGLPDKHVKPVYDALRADPASRVVARVLRRQSGLMLPLDELVERGLPEDAMLVAAVVREDADETPLTVLRRLVDAVRSRERQGGREHTDQWMAVRGLVHQHLASRASRIAMYDLRETLEQARGPIPVGFLAAVATIGDAACLEPIARAWIEAPTGERWWRDHLMEAFGAIVRREQIHRRHKRLAAILTRWPTAAPLVALAKKSSRG